MVPADGASTRTWSMRFLLRYQSPEHANPSATRRASSQMSQSGKGVSWTSVQKNAIIYITDMGGFEGMAMDIPILNVSDLSTKRELQMSTQGCFPIPYLDMFNC